MGVKFGVERWKTRCLGSLRVQEISDVLHSSPRHLISAPGNELADTDDSAIVSRNPTTEIYGSMTFSTS